MWAAHPPQTRGERTAPSTNSAPLSFDIFCYKEARRQAGTEQSKIWESFHSIPRGLWKGSLGCGSNLIPNARPGPQGLC